MTFEMSNNARGSSEDNEISQLSSPFFFLVLYFLYLVTIIRLTYVYSLLSS